MIASASIALLWGVLIWFLIRFTSLRAWPAVTCIVFGFYVGSTPLAPYIRSTLVALARLVGIEL